mgnify:CR=1 FL=1
MNKPELTMDDLLNALKNPEKVEKGDLANIKETWTRIGDKDKFEELGLEGSELDNFLKEWIDLNPYSNI